MKKKLVEKALGGYYVTGMDTYKPKKVKKNLRVENILCNKNMNEKIKKILDENEIKFGADYGNRNVNDEGIIFDYSGFGYHVRVKNIKDDEKDV